MSLSKKKNAARMRVYRFEKKKLGRTAHFVQPVYPPKVPYGTPVLNDEPDWAGARHANPQLDADGNRIYEGL